MPANASDDGAADNDHRDNGSRRHLGDRDAAGRRRPADRGQREAVDGAAIRRRSAHRAPGLGAPLPHGAAVHAGTWDPAGQRESPAAQPLQRADARSADLRLPPVQRAVAAPLRRARHRRRPFRPLPRRYLLRRSRDLENPVEQSGASSASTPTAPLVGSAHLMRVIDPADSGAEAGRAAGADGHAGTPAATLPTASSAGVPSLSSSVPSSPRPGHGSPSAMDVQRTVGGDLPPEKARPGAELTAEPADGVADSASATPLQRGTAVAPTLGAASVRSGVVERQQESSRGSSRLQRPAPGGDPPRTGPGRQPRRTCSGAPKPRLPVTSRTDQHRRRRRRATTSTRTDGSPGRCAGAGSTEPPAD